MSRCYSARAGHIGHQCLHCPFGRQEVHRWLCAAGALFGACAVTSRARWRRHMLVGRKCCRTAEAVVVARSSARAFRILFVDHMSNLGPLRPPFLMCDFPPFGPRGCLLLQHQAQGSRSDAGGTCSERRGAVFRGRRRGRRDGSTRRLRTAFMGRASSEKSRQAGHSSVVGPWTTLRF